MLAEVIDQSAEPAPQTLDGGRWMCVDAVPVPAADRALVGHARRYDTDWFRETFRDPLMAPASWHLTVATMAITAAVNQRFPGVDMLLSTGDDELLVFLHEPDGDADAVSMTRERMAQYVPALDMVHVLVRERAKEAAKEAAALPEPWSAVTPTPMKVAAVHTAVPAAVPADPTDPAADAVPTVPIKLCLGVVRRFADLAADLPPADRESIAARLAGGGCHQGAPVYLDQRLVLDAAREVRAAGYIVGKQGANLARMVDDARCADRVVLWTIDAELWMLWSADAERRHTDAVLKRLLACTRRFLCGKARRRTTASKRQ
jgi:hypothetical protein